METPTTAIDVREMEINMRLLVHLYERATRSLAGSQEDFWCDKLYRHLIHAEAAARYLKEATRSNIVRKITDMMVLRKQGVNYSITVTSAADQKKSMEEAEKIYSGQDRGWVTIQEGRR